ncbi:MotE family protein [Sulfitobacter sp. S190]|uniref:MotE family protein n=1 Tax=Sulfitobacter sp. S190 TaxID=2867022 RepID=UPI0021A2BA58|nr:hypothetical protein [Sulfitobacter sp. S190]UWR22360.1 hypothetical protein K3756_17125 [Sulfitobacter sp. S190]
MSRAATRLSRRMGRGTILTISALLIASAVVRVATGVAAAAGEDMLPTQERPQSLADSAQSGGSQGSGLDIAKDGGNVTALVQALQAREERVGKQEKQIQMRLQALAIADAEIEKRLSLLAQTEADLRATLALADQAAERDIAKLTAVYENMKPKQAGPVFEAMETSFAAGFLGRMQPENAAAILASMTPETAYSISIILAGRNANVPKN